MPESYLQFGAPSKTIELMPPKACLGECHQRFFFDGWGEPPSPHHIQIHTLIALKTSLLFLHAEKSNTAKLKQITTNQYMLYHFQT